MATDQAVEEYEVLDVKSFAAVEGNQGPQWQLAATAFGSQYTRKYWMPKKSGDALEPGKWPCLLVRRKGSLL